MTIRIWQRYSFVAAVIGIVILHGALSVGKTMTVRPWSDEGAMACPAYNLLTSGTSGTTIWEEAGSDFKGINVHTYYLMPLDVWAQAVWYSMVRVGLIQMRLLSLLWALLALGGWFLILRILFGDRRIELLGVGLIAVDYFFVDASSFGRMDMMSAALGFSGLAVFLVFRKRNLTVALLFGNALVAASILTHPMGMVHCAGLQILTLYFSRRDLTIARLACIAAPYIAAAGIWTAYILPNPSDFIVQFRANANYMNRLAGVSAPWMGVFREIRDRYGVAFGLGPHSPATQGPVFLKAVVLAAYVGGLAICLTLPVLRQKPSMRLLATLSLVYFLMMSVIDGGKAAYYLVHILPIFAVLLAVATIALTDCKPSVAWLAGLWIAAVVVIQVGAVAERMRINTYENRYMPVLSFLKENLAPGKIVFATSAFGFDLGFRQEKLIDDSRLGYYSGKRPDFIVVDEIYRDTFAGHRLHRPLVAAYVNRLLAQEYRVAYSIQDIQVYKRVSVDGSLN